MEVHEEVQQHVATAGLVRSCVCRAEPVRREESVREARDARAAVERAHLIQVVYGCWKSGRKV